MCFCRAIGATLALASAMCFPMTVRGQCETNEVAKLLASDGAPGDGFGGHFGVSISGDDVVIGVWHDDDAGLNSGSAYVFHLDGTAWNEKAKLTASDGAPGDEFGISVAISGNTIVIGAYLDDNENGNDAGSAYVYHFDGTDWNEQAKLSASDGAPGDRFAASLSIIEDIVVIGAYLDDNENGNDAGSAYVFRFDGTDWNEEAKLLPYDGDPGDHFGGSAISISGDVAVIGVHFDDNENGSDAGSAYAYRFDGTDWNEEAKLTASDGAPRDWFGVSVSISGDVVVIGGHGDDSSTGSAYVHHFDGTDWNEEAKLTASDGAPDDRFAISVSFSGDMVVIGAPNDGDCGGGAGSAYVFMRPSDGWGSIPSPIHEDAKLLASDCAAGDYFGYGVSISGDVAVIGAYADDDNGTNSGSAYVFGGLSDCSENGTLDICDIQDGSSQDENGNGIPDECEDSDGDGVPDDMDNCPNSDLGESIIIDDCDTGVGNELFDDGCTMADRIAECAEGVTTHGEFVSCGAQLTNDWKQDGLISGRDKGRIQSCTAQGNLWSQCQTDADCDDGLFCNGVEVCLDGACVVGEPCPGQSCDEATDECID